MHETKLDHILVIFQVSDRIDILHGKALVGIRRQVNRFFLVILLLLAATALQQLLFRFALDALDGRLGTVRVHLKGGNPTAFGVTNVDVRLLLRFVVRHGVSLYDCLSKCKYQKQQDKERVL